MEQACEPQASPRQATRASPLHRTWWPGQWRCGPAEALPSPRPWPLESEEGANTSQASGGNGARRHMDTRYFLP